MTGGNFVLNAISTSPLYLVELPGTKCRIIKNNGSRVYCGVYPTMKGLFRKDVETTKKFGRYICDAVADEMNNHGFLTSDETPEYGVSYGISKKEYEAIFKQTEASRDHHLVVMFAYTEREALETQSCFETLLRKAYLNCSMESAGVPCRF